MIGYMLFAQWYWSGVNAGGEAYIKKLRHTPYAAESKDLKEAKVGDRSTGWGAQYRKLP